MRNLWRGATVKQDGKLVMLKGKVIDQEWWNGLLARCSSEKKAKKKRGRPRKEEPTIVSLDSFLDDGGDD